MPLRGQGSPTQRGVPPWYSSLCPGPSLEPSCIFLPNPRLQPCSASPWVDQGHPASLCLPLPFVPEGGGSPRCLWISGWASGVRTVHTLRQGMPGGDWTGRLDRTLEPVGLGAVGYSIDENVSLLLGVVPTTCCLITPQGEPTGAGPGPRQGETWGGVSARGADCPWTSWNFLLKSQNQRKNWPQGI